MCRSALSRPPVLPAGREPLHVVQVPGGGESSGTHVQTLAAGVAARGLRVTVAAPSATRTEHCAAGTEARSAAGRVRTDPDAVAALRQQCGDAGLVHAHGLRAGLLASLALAGCHPAVPLVVTWHGHDAAAGVHAPLLRLLERRVARSASVVLGATTELVDLARRRGARDARLAPVAVPALRTAADEGARQRIRAARSRARERPDERSTVAQVLAVYDELTAPVP